MFPDNLFKTAYLRVSNNKVSDVISAETEDLVQVKVQLSYQVDFEGDPKKWFNVENYVKFLTDQLFQFCALNAVGYTVSDANIGDVCVAGLDL